MQQSEHTGPPYRGAQGLPKPKPKPWTLSCVHLRLCRVDISADMLASLPVGVGAAPPIRFVHDVALAPVRAEQHLRLQGRGPYAHTTAATGHGVSEAARPPQRSPALA
jgi:hypothetical protein